MVDTLSNLDIENTISRFRRLKNQFLGCFSANTIPRGHQPPYALIVNLDPDTRPGSHWVAMFVSNTKTIDYFDSLGDGPPKGEIGDFVSTFARCNNWSRPIQSIGSSVCGHYAVYFILQRSLNCEGRKIVDRLQRLGKNADVWVRQVYHRLRL